MARATLWIALVLTFAGCTAPDGGDADNSTDDAPDMDTDAAALPAPIEDSQQVQAGVDPLTATGQPPCTSPSAQCVRYPFELNTTARLSATLTWTVPANDFDLFLYEDGEPTDLSSTAGAPGTSEEIEENIGAGSYELLVVAYAAFADTFTISATFEPAAAETNEST